MKLAAERLLVTQPAISLALKRLEETVQVKLIDRGVGKISTTPAGEALFKEACKVYAAVTRLPIAFEKAPMSVSWQITISSISQVESKELDRALSAFFLNFPKTELLISSSTTKEIIRSVELGRVTMGISDGVIPETLVKQFLRREEFGMFCGRNHRLFGKGELSVAELRGEPFIGFTADIVGGEHMGDVTALRAQASIGQKMRGQSSNVYEVCRMIRTGLGIGMLPLHLAVAFEESGDLWRLPPYKNAPSADIYLICNPATNFNPAERAFLDQLFEAEL